MVTLTRIRRHEVGLAFRHGDFDRVLSAGSYRLFGRLFGSTKVEVYNTLEDSFAHPLMDVLLAEADVRAIVHVVEVAADQRALFWKNGRVQAILDSGRHVFWKNDAEVRFELIDLPKGSFEHESMNEILETPGAIQLSTFRVASHERTLFYRNGQLVKSASGERVVFWRHGGDVQAKTIDLRERALEIGGQELMTKDRVTLRVTMVARFQVTDAEAAVSKVDDHGQAIYRSTQLALRKAIGSRTLDELLAAKEAVGIEVTQAVRSEASAFGVDVRAVGLRDVILPGEMKSILNQVIQAEKRSEANLIRRREETAAARSQANTAKLLDANPTLARMKELETLSDILRGANPTFVFGSMDVLEQVRGLTRSSE